MKTEYNQVDLGLYLVVAMREQKEWPVEELSNFRAFRMWVSIVIKSRPSAFAPLGRQAARIRSCSHCPLRHVHRRITCPTTGPDVCPVELDMPNVLSSRVKTFVHDVEAWANLIASLNRHGASRYAKAQ